MKREKKIREGGKKRRRDEQKKKQVGEGWQIRAS